MGETERETSVTKKDEGEAFRTGKVLDTPKPAAENAPRDKELVNN